MDKRKEMIQEARHELRMATLTVIKIDQLKRIRPYLNDYSQKHIKSK